MHGQAMTGLQLELQVCMPFSHILLPDDVYTRYTLGSSIAVCISDNTTRLHMPNTKYSLEKLEQCKDTSAQEVQHRLQTGFWQRKS